MDPSPRETCMSVRLATLDDAESMRAVYAPYVETPVTFDTAAPSPAEFSARMADAMRAYPCLALEQSGRIVGFAYAHAQASRAAYRWNAELSVYLGQGATGCGWGRVLYGALLELLRAQGIKSAYGLVTLPNAASERLHEAFGFKRCWVQPHAGWKAGAWHDVAWYVKELAPLDDDPADPVPFDELARTRLGFVRQVLANAGAALVRRA
ncbi:GNAT family N-acetyltransferase [Gordonibacter massiliensis (ex Traore et al. 2017)]|uniref:N-acetyltransferase n=1 Tax=Gordonibacter massiliensis (ex Traore et al. 2017) TaxID=1841863 RepID=A0A842JGB0_9ACTN|nr:GNAT family N-acetyltransferase [Gordonibacter massiliensis (ex Traore et al. 2017)]MBC2890036.1 N-acetyltransferase [Gordonibacter massiliensis (ex Traore et al. 2017)]